MSIHPVIFFLIFLNINCFYVFQLKSTFDYDPSENLTNEQIFHNLFYNHIYSELTIGEPSKKLNTFLKTKEYCSYIASYTSKLNNSDYEPENSTTFKNITDYNLEYKNFKDACLANENIKLSTNFNSDNSDLTKISIEKFYYAPNNPKSEENPYKSGVFGFKYQNENEQCQSFIDSVKNNSGTTLNRNNTVFTIEYDENYTRLILGEYPHVYEKNHYIKENFTKVFMNDSVKETKNDYHLTFTEIYFYKENRIGSQSKKISISDPNLMESIFVIEQNMFVVPEEFFNLYEKNFFSQYSKACNKLLINGTYVSYFCNKKKLSLITPFLHGFPTVFFYNNMSNFIFEFNYKNLLVEKDDYYYFMMSFNNKTKSNVWEIGKIFMQKYLFTFNLLEKYVGFYTTKGDYEDYSFNFLEDGIFVMIILGANILVVVSCILFAIIHKCTKSSVDPTVMIESFSGNVDDVKKNLNENNEEEGNENDNVIKTSSE